MKKKVFGIVLLVLAALVLLQGNFGIPSLEGEIWPLIGIGFFAYQSVEAILRRHFTSASVTALVALMIANHFYDIFTDSQSITVLGECSHRAWSKYADSY